MTALKKHVSDPLLIDGFGRIVPERYRRYYVRSLVIAGVLGTIEGVALFAVLPTITAFWLDTPQMGLTWVGWIVVYAVLALAGLVLATAQSYVGYHAAIGLLRHTSVGVGDRIAKLPLGWFRAGFSGKASRMLTGAIVQLGESAASIVTPIVRAGMTSLVIIVASLWWAWQLALALLLALPFLAALMVASRACGRRGEALKARAQDDLASRIVEYAATQPALRSCGRTRTYAPLNDARAESTRALSRATWLESLGMACSGVGVQAITAVLVALGAWLGATGRLTPVGAVAVIGVALRYMTVLDDAAAAAVGVESARRPLADLHEVIDAPVLPEVDAEADLTAPGRVEFEHVTFAYDTKKVLADVTWQAEPGEMTAIVGPSGAGKTTLFRLIARFWDVQEGAVRVGGVDVRDQPTRQLMGQLAMVFQDVYLFDSTLYDNIAIGREDADRDDVLAVARLAGVDEIARRLPAGWDSQVGEGGARLSGGERQRVSVARALLKDAPIVLLDEATSALDPDNEEHVARSIEQLRERATVLVIAHKLDTIRRADRVVVLDATGSVAQVGTHEELIATGGLYQELWAARERARGWSLVAQGNEG